MFELFEKHFLICSYFRLNPCSNRSSFESLFVFCILFGSNLEPVMEERNKKIFYYCFIQNIIFYT